MSEPTKEEKFDLDAPAQNNYVNMILQDMKNYNYWTSVRYDVGTASITRTKLALKQLIRDMPPKGKAFMQQQIPALTNLNAIDKIENYEEADAVYDLAISWLWPNLLELHMNTGKPAYGADAHLGNKPR